MTQMTIELDSDSLRTIQDNASRENLPPNRWLAYMVRRMLQDKEKVDEYNGWSPEVFELAGAFPDFPTLEEIRGSAGEDAVREAF